MTLAELNFVSSSSFPLPNKPFAFVLLATSDAGKALLRDPEGSYPEIAEQLAGLNATGKVDELNQFWSPSHQAPIFVIGAGNEPDVNALRERAGSASRRIRNVQALVFDFAPENSEQQAAIAEGAGHGIYRYDRYRTLPEDFTPIEEITVLGDHIDSNHHQDLIHSIQVTIRAVSRTKDLVNTPAQDLYPEEFAKQVLEYVADLPIDATVWDEQSLQSEGFGGIFGVGQGSTRPPRLVKLHYKPTQATQHIALVGKGITFDTGGLSLKPAGSMVGMKYDMTGAATAFAVITAAAELGFDTEITAWLALAENMPSGSATRPNDVLTMRGGKTVEVMNTDAEGRLV